MSSIISNNCKCTLPLTKTISPKQMISVINYCIFDLNISYNISKARNLAAIFQSQMHPPRINSIYKKNQNPRSIPETPLYYNDVIMSAVASQITGVSIVYSTFCSDADQRKHQSSASLAFFRGILNSLHRGPVMRKMFPFDDVVGGGGGGGEKGGEGGGASWFPQPN